MLTIQFNKIFYYLFLVDNKRRMNRKKLVCFHERKQRRYIATSSISIVRHGNQTPLTFRLFASHVYFCEAFVRHGVRLTLLRRFLPAGHNELQGRKKIKTYIPYRLIRFNVSIAEDFGNLCLYFGCSTRYRWRKSYPWRASAWKHFSWLQVTKW